MFFREYLWMAYIAAIVAFPSTYAVMHQWLEQYAYHISIGMDLFIVWLGIVIIMVLFTILQQVVQAARQNYGSNPSEYTIINTIMIKTLY